MYLAFSCTQINPAVSQGTCSWCWCWQSGHLWCWWHYSIGSWKRPCLQCVLWSQMRNQFSCLLRWCGHGWGLLFGDNDQLQWGHRWLFGLLGCCRCQCVREKDCVSSLGDTWTSLCHAMEFFAHCLDPRVLEQGILGELPLVCNCLLHDRVYSAICSILRFQWLYLYIDLGQDNGGLWR